ncbi:MAG: T9SS type A sorting domain-containing protein [Bacteroidota bacterium]
MKKVYLLTLILGISVGLMAQHAPVNSELYDHSVEVDASEKIHDMGSNTSSHVIPYSPSRLSINETDIGQSVYDLQSNSSVNNRFTRFQDGSMAAVWTMGFESPSFADRGTGYNYYDGTEWGPMPEERIEDENVGWPYHAPLGENGEIVVGHTPNGLKISKRDTKGAGDWDYENFMGPDGAEGLTWPEVTTTGDNNDVVHLVANSYDPYEGQETALLYSRSTDGGETWVDENIILEGMGSDYYTEINADDYIWASRGDVAALVVSSPWHDLFIMKTEDNGENWEKIVAWEHPYPMFDWEETITTDTIWAPDGSMGADIDSEGNVHLSFGLTRVIHEEPGTSYNYFPFTDAIVYWNENMDPFENPDNQHYALKYENLEEDVTLVAWTPDMNNNGVLDIESTDEILPYRTLGMVTMPTLKIDEDDDVALVYTALHEELFGGEFYYRHIFGREKVGSTWGDIVHLTSGDIHMFDECIYPQMANILPDDENIYLHYQKDNTPGLALDEDHDWVTNTIVGMEVSMDEFGTISNENGLSIDEKHKVSQNFPNPFSSTSEVSVEVTEDAQLSMEVVNLVGQTVQHVDKGFVNAGTHSLEISGTNLETGVYFYNVNINDETITKKMIIR